MTTAPSFIAANITPRAVLDFQDHQDVIAAPHAQTFEEVGYLVGPPAIPQRFV